MIASSIRSIAADLATESKDSAKRIAHDLFGDVPYGAERLTKREFLDMVRRNWPDANYRQGLLVRIGAEAFLDAAQEAGVIAPGWQQQAQAMEAQP